VADYLLLSPPKTAQEEDEKPIYLRFSHLQDQDVQLYTVTKCEPLNLALTLSIVDPSSENRRWGWANQPVSFWTRISLELSLTGPKNSLGPVGCPAPGPYGKPDHQSSVYVITLAVELYRNTNMQTHVRGGHPQLMTSGSVGQRVYIFSLAIFQMNLIVCFRSVPYFLWLRWILLQLHAVIAAALNSSSTNLPVKSFKFLSRLELSKHNF